MYEWRDQTLKPGQCDCCGALRGHLKGCLDEPLEIRQHSEKLFAPLWERDKLSMAFLVSVGAAIVVNIVVWWDVIELLF